MNVLIVSQCDKRALVETRRILDQFAERRGDRTWQTAITQDGLDTLRRLLRKTARKNTAVACHWIRGLDHSELLWVVGDTRRFNAQGAVPTNTTTRNVLRQEDENSWHTAEDIRLLAQMAALLHDLGKASVAFQQRLRGQRVERNFYRHEWVSLRLFQAFVGHDDDATWLARLANPSEADLLAWTEPGRYVRDGLDEGPKRPFEALPPLAAAIGWLVVSHHRLPLVPVYDDEGQQAHLGRRPPVFRSTWLTRPLSHVEHDWNEVGQDATAEQIAPYWDVTAGLPIHLPKWKRQAAKLSARLANLIDRREAAWLDNPYVMHVARLCLMLADHHYSGLELPAERVRGDETCAAHANTDSKGRLKQALDEHLLGVTRDAGLIAHALPDFGSALPAIRNHRALRKRTAHPRFTWQNKAADAAGQMRSAAAERGAFIVNMASTGCGKTLANARVLHALSDPDRGMRLTYALGLRALTLQTGRSYRNDLGLGEDDLAIRVGGAASRALFDYYEQQAEATGSASVQSLMEEDGHVLYEGQPMDHPLLSRALKDDRIRSLLAAPVLVCTVDHIVPATEATRAGRQIAPMLRLMSSDLVLDELDDYDLKDLPALTRLVYWAGLLGARVVLSSATLPPALVQGMFMAYRAGRVHHQRNRAAHPSADHEGLKVPCLWVDEYGAQGAECLDADACRAQHDTFVQKRVQKLQSAEPTRLAALWPLDLTMQAKKPLLRAELAEQIRQACLRLHADHAQVCPISGRRISFGLVRMANIDPLFDVAQALFCMGAPEGIRIHLCVYHARFPLVQRSAIEHMLDTALNRREPQAVFDLPSVRDAIDAHPEPDQLFVVLASPVCEVGRDWDADWAVAEPSSVRSLIQLAGRVQRHRAQKPERPNVFIFDTNLKHFEGRKMQDGYPAAIFVQPGFEDARARLADVSSYRLEARRLGKLMTPDEYTRLHAVPRIMARPPGELNHRRRLVDLEQARMMDCMLPMAETAKVNDTADQLNASSGWTHPQAGLTGFLPQRQRFREETGRSVTLVFLPDEDGDRLEMHRVEQQGRGRHTERLYVPVNLSQRHDVTLELGPRIGAWGLHDLMTLLQEQAEYLELPLSLCAQRMAVVEVPENDQGWRCHPWLGLTRM